MAARFTDDELEDIIHQMGQQVNTPAHIRMMSEEVKRLYAEEDSIHSDRVYDEDVMNQSLFASLSIDPDQHFLRRRPVDPRSIHSPIVSRRRRGKFNEYENIDLPDEHEEGFAEYPEAKSLIGEAYASMSRVYNTCRGVAEVLESLSLEGSEAVDDEEVADEEYEPIGSSVSVPGSSQGSQGSQATTAKSSAPNMIIVDPSVRPVLSPKPGRAPYKFDPVTRYHLYKEEWDRHPAPGELKRLSLRWKVREYMLRHDVPRLNANLNGRVEHDKDWSPRPYLD